MAEVFRRRCRPEATRSCAATGLWTASGSFWVKPMQDFHQFSKSCPKFRMCGFPVAKLKIHHDSESIKDSQLSYQQSHRFDLLVVPNHPGVSHSPMSCPASASTKGVLADRVCRAREWICREPGIWVKKDCRAVGNGRDANCRWMCEFRPSFNIIVFVMLQTRTGHGTPVDE